MKCLVGRFLPGNHHLIFLSITSRQLQPLETYYKKLHRKIQQLPQSTANHACYVFLSTLFIEAIVHLNKEQYSPSFARWHNQHTLLPPLMNIKHNIILIFLMLMLTIRSNCRRFFNKVTGKDAVIFLLE